MKSVEDPGWQLLEAGNYKAAIERFHRDFKRTGAEGFLVNVGIAHLCEGHTKSAVKTFEDVISLPFDVGGVYAYLGVAQWICEQTERAILSWEKGRHCDYQDAAGGMELPLLLYYAAATKPDSYDITAAEKALKKQLRHPWSKAWPGPVGAFLVGRFDQTKVRKKAGFPQSDVMRRQVAQVEFYVGVDAITKGDRTLFFCQMKKTASMESCQLLAESYLAEYEITRGEKWAP